MQNDTVLNVLALCTFPTAGNCSVQPMLVCIRKCPASRAYTGGWVSSWPRRSPRGQVTYGVRPNHHREQVLINSHKLSFQCGQEKFKKLCLFPTYLISWTSSVRSSSKPNTSAVLANCKLCWENSWPCYFSSFALPLVTATQLHCASSAIPLQTPGIRLSKRFTWKRGDLSHFSSTKNF